MRENLLLMLLVVLPALSTGRGGGAVRGNISKIFFLYSLIKWWWLQGPGTTRVKVKFSNVDKKISVKLKTANWTTTSGGPRVIFLREYRPTNSTQSVTLTTFRYIWVIAAIITIISVIFGIWTECCPVRFFPQNILLNNQIPKENCQLC